MTPAEIAKARQILAGRYEHANEHKWDSGEHCLSVLWNGGAGWRLFRTLDEVRANQAAWKKSVEASR